MQWSLLTEGKQKNQLAQTEVLFIKTIIIIRGGQLQVVLRLHVSVALQQKTASFKVAIVSRPMQWSLLTEGKQNNQLAQTEVLLIKTITIIGGGNYSQHFASTTALHCSKRRQISRLPQRADRCSGVC
jgi:hypothetical protein